MKQWTTKRKHGRLNTKPQKEFLSIGNLAVNPTSNNHLNAQRFLCFKVKCQ